MKIKTSELTGAALDWAVAKADDNLQPRGSIRLLDGKVFHIEPGDHETADRWVRYSPSTEWAQCGPIIEREEIELTHAEQFEVREIWLASANQKGLPKGMKGYYQMLGPTPLIAAMRCYVASELGDEVDVPEELI